MGPRACPMRIALAPQAWCRCSGQPCRRSFGEERQGVSQRELADRLGVHESQVSRDERSEHPAASLERANRALEELEALEAEIRITVIRPTPPPQRRGRA